MNLCSSLVELGSLARTPWTASDLGCCAVAPSHLSSVSWPRPLPLAGPPPGSRMPVERADLLPGHLALGKEGRSAGSSRCKSLTCQQPALHCSPLPTAVNRHKLGAFKDTDLSPYSSEGQTFKISPSELKARWWKGCVPSGGPGETLLPLLLQLLEAHEFTGWCITSSPLTPTLLHPSYEDP